MRLARGILVGAIPITKLLAGCAQDSGERMLTREVFAAAVSKCQPLDANFIQNEEGPPSVEISIPFGSSTVPDCMAKEFDGYALQQLQIKYVRSDNE